MLEFFRRYVLNDLRLKLLALGIAIGLWWTLGREPTVESIVTARIEVEVMISGPERTVRDIKPSDISAVLDLTGVKPGERTFDLGPRQVQVPRGVTVTGVVPSQIHIDFNPSATRTVEVRPRVIGSFVSGYGITEVSADPATVTVEGPENHVKAIDTAITDPVDVSGVMGKATFTIHVYVPDPLVRVQHPAPIHVTVTTGKSSRGAGQP